MPKFIVNHPAGLFLPGAEAASQHGSEVDIKGDNAAVKGWIEAGLLVAPKDFAKPLAAADAALAQAQADLADRDATIADQAAQIAKLTADLEAATKPAK